MLWTVHHLWPSGACLVFNCYLHRSSLVLRNGNGMSSFMHSREGATQGDPLAMVAYGIGILPPIKNMKEEFPESIQPWYADDASVLGTFARVKSYYNSLKQHSPGQGYFTPNPLKAFWLCIRKIPKP